METTEKPNEEPKRKVVSLDLDGTVLGREFDYNLWGECGYEGVLWKFVGQKLGVTPREAYDISSQRIPEVPNGTISIKGWIDYWSLPQTEQEIIDAVEEKLETYPDYDAVKAELQRKKTRTILCTESSGYMLERKLEGSGIRNDFDAVYSSVALSNGPKNQEFFERVLTLEGIRPEQMIHVGDSYHKDVEVPGTLGIRAFYVPTERNSEATVRRENQLDSLLELSRLVEI